MRLKMTIYFFITMPPDFLQRLSAYYIFENMYYISSKKICSFVLHFFFFFCFSHQNNLRCFMDLSFFFSLRMASNLLHHDYGVELSNVFDTAVADSVVMASHQFKGFKPDFVRSYQVFSDSLPICKVLSNVKRPDCVWQCLTVTDNWLRLTWLTVADCDLYE